MAKELPYFKFYPSEWITGDITLLSNETQGVFINMCIYYWMKDCNLSLANAKQRFSKCLANINELLEQKILKIDSNENIIINFLDEQMNEFVNVSEKRAIAGAKGGLAKAKQMLSKRLAKSSNIEKIREEKIREDKIREEKEINISFDEFWNLYDKKVGDKSKLIKKWNDLSDDDRQLIIDYIPEYKKSQPDKKFRKDPLTFFNNKSWNDEIIGVFKSTERNTKLY